MCRLILRYLLTQDRLFNLKVCLHSFFLPACVFSLKHAIKPTHFLVLLQPCNSTYNHMLVHTHARAHIYMQMNAQNFSRNICHQQVYPYFIFFTSFCIIFELLSHVQLSRKTFLPIHCRHIQAQSFKFLSQTAGSFLC